jgi:uncharacterized membrane protein (UPF0127 family)
MKIIRVKLGKKTLRIKKFGILGSARGLMFDDMKKTDGALIYGNSVWMPFVKYDLDLLFLDENFIVVDVQKAVPITLNPKTWRFYDCSRAKYCLEIKRRPLKTKKGMKVKI